MVLPRHSNQIAKENKGRSLGGGIRFQGAQYKKIWQGIEERQQQDIPAYIFSLPRSAWWDPWLGKFSQ